MYLCSDIWLISVIETRIDIDNNIQLKREIAQNFSECDFILKKIIKLKSIIFEKKAVKFIDKYFWSFFIPWK